MRRIHGGCVALAGSGVILRGPSGSGKSDLALRLIDQGARLVSDDQTDVFASEGLLFAAPPDALAGMMEVRGAGLVAIPHLPWSRVDLVVDLVSGGQVERQPESAHEELCGIAVRQVCLAAFETSAPAKIRAIVAGQRSRGQR